MSLGLRFCISNIHVMPEVASSGPHFKQQVPEILCPGNTVTHRVWERRSFSSIYYSMYVSRLLQECSIQISSQVNHLIYTFNLHNINQLFVSQTAFKFVHLVLILTLSTAVYITLYFHTITGNYSFSLHSKLKEKKKTLSN